MSVEGSGSLFLPPQGMQDAFRSSEKPFSLQQSVYIGGMQRLG